MSSPKLQVMLVDDHEIVRRGIRTILEAAGDIQVVAEAGSAEEAIERAERSRPDLIVMDIRLASGSGIDATREIRNRLPGSRVLMLTSFGDDEALMASIMAGAAGYVLKRVTGDDLVEGIRAVAAGQSLLDPAVTRSVLDRFRNGRPLSQNDKLGRLTAQEGRVLALVADGKTNRQIAGDLGLTERTVKNYLSSVYAKLNVGRRAEAAAYVSRRKGRIGPSS